MGCCKALSYKRVDVNAQIKPDTSMNQTIWYTCMHLVADEIPSPFREHKAFSILLTNSMNSRYLHYSYHVKQFLL